MAYNPTIYVNDSTPAISAENLNKMEQGIYDNDTSVNYLMGFTGRNYLDTSTMLENKTSGGNMSTPGQITTYNTANLCTNPPLLLKGGKTYYVRIIYSGSMDILLWNENGGGVSARTKTDSKKHQISVNGYNITVYDDSFTLSENKWICVNSQMGSGIYTDVLMITDFDFGHDYIYYDTETAVIKNTSLNDEIEAIQDELATIPKPIIIPKNKCYQVTQEGVKSGINSPSSSLTVVESSKKKFGATTYDATIPVNGSDADYEIYFELDNMLNLASKYKGFWVYMDSDTANDVKKAIFYIGNDSQIFTHNNMYSTIWSFVGGWNYVGNSDNTFGYTSTFDARYTTFVGLKLFFYGTTKEHHIIFDSVTGGMKTNPIYTINFDGWKKSTWDIMAPYLKNKNVPFTLFLSDIESSDIGIEDLLNIADYGGELQMYSGQPASAYSADTFSTQYSKMRGIRDEHLENGNKVSIVSLSGGVNNNVTERVIHNLNLKLARKTKNGDMEQVDGETLFTLNSSFGDSTATLDSLKTTVNRCITYGKITSVMSHNIRYEGDTGGNYNMSEELMKGWVDYLSDKIQSGDLTCMTYSELREKCCFPSVDSVALGTHALLYESDGQYHEYLNNGVHWQELI